MLFFIIYFLFVLGFRSVYLIMLLLNKERVIKNGKPLLNIEYSMHFIYISIMFIF
jgi:hypothetical protein